MRKLLRKIIIWALGSVEPPNLDPSDLDKHAAENK
jgi:hypothetical protein